MYKFSLTPKAQKEAPPASNRDVERVDRESPREQVCIPAYLHGAGECQSTVITDLSVDGAGLDGAIAIFPGDNVEIELINGRRISGQVIWWLMGSCGVQFETPLAKSDPIFSSTPATDVPSQ